MKSRIQTCVAYFSSALCCFLCLCLSFLFSLSLLCVYLLSFSVSTFFFLLSVLPSFYFYFFFTCACFSLFIERFQRNCSLFFSQLIRSWSSFLQFFSSTTPNFMFSRDPLFSLFLYSLFCCLLNSFSVCDSPLSPNRVPHFLMVIFLYSLFSI